jgi:hypothetical protein
MLDDLATPVENVGPRLQAGRHAVEHRLVLQTRDPAPVGGAARTQRTGGASRRIAMIRTGMCTSVPPGEPYRRTTRASRGIRRRSITADATAEPARAILDVETIDVVADRGYFKIEDIEACEKAGLTPHVPKPQRGSSVRNGLFRKDEFRECPNALKYLHAG